MMMSPTYLHLVLPRPSPPPLGRRLRRTTFVSHCDGRASLLRWVGKTSYSLRTRPRRESCLCTPLCTRRGEHERRTAEATSPIRESSLISSLIPTQVLVVTLLLVLVLLGGLYLRVPNGNTEEPAQMSLRSVSVLILDHRFSISWALSA